MIIRQLNVDDAQALHGLYQQTPQYFRVISMPMPNLMDVQAELETGLSDPRRELSFLYADLGGTPRPGLGDGAHDGRGDGGQPGDVPDRNAAPTTLPSPRLVKDDASRLL
ncbi:MAG TPA: hypothetical protein VHN99_11400, partial [Deinococcales bacterium]|nr:hypothetical protein [Deinococcales bacterium]